VFIDDLVDGHELTQSLVFMSPFPPLTQLNALCLHVEAETSATALGPTQAPQLLSRQVQKVDSTTKLLTASPVPSAPVAPLTEFPEAPEG